MAVSAVRFSDLSVGPTAVLLRVAGPPGETDGEGRGDGARRSTAAGSLEAPCPGSDGHARIGSVVCATGFPPQAASLRTMAASGFAPLHFPYARPFVATTESGVGRQTHRGR